MPRHQNHHSSSFRMQDIARSIFRVGFSAPSGAIWRFSYFRWWHSWGFWIACSRHNVVSEKPKFAFKPILPTPCIIIIHYTLYIIHYTYTLYIIHYTLYIIHILYNHYRGILIHTTNRIWLYPQPAQNSRLV